MKSFLQATPVAGNSTRLHFLDALRGLAILVVFLFHTYARWPQLTPYGDRYSEIVFLKYGWLGVHLFFLISGFVIFMTLEKCTGTFDFLKRRWLRLFPAMLICSLIVYATASFFSARPLGMPRLRDLLPGLTFIEPLIWENVVHSQQGVLEGAFWSLFVEAEFYVVAGSLFFLIGRRNLILVLAGIFTLGEALYLLHADQDSHGMSLAINSMKQFGWFAAGALFYCYFFERRVGYLQGAIVMSLLAAFGTSGMDWDVLRATLCVIALFGTAICSHRFRQLIATKPLMLLGFVSYPLYLMHENMAVSAIVQLHHAGLGIPLALLPVIPFGGLVIVSYCIARYLEPLVRAGIRRLGKAGGPAAARHSTR